MKNFPITENRFIAYFDIMGFKDLIYRNTHEAVSVIMDSITTIAGEIKQTESDLLRRPKEERGDYLDKSVILPVIFSDSIVFISESDTAYDAMKIFFVAAFFMKEAMKTSVPVKGSIAHGLFTADFEKSKFYGQPLVDAYLLTEETVFYGATLHNTAEKQIHEDVDSADYRDLLSIGKIPMRCGNVTHYFLNWQFLLDEDDETTAKEILNHFYLTASGGVRKYVDNSIDIYLKNS